MTGAAEAPPSASPKGSRSGGLLGSPWIAVIAVVLALALVAASVVVVRNRSAEPAPLAAPALGEMAPSAFQLDTSFASAAMVHRGEAVTLAIAAAPDADVQRVEVWRDGVLEYQVDDPTLIVQPATGAVRFSYDLVPMTAGAHVVVTRAYDSEGRLAQSVPLAIPAMDLPQDLGQEVLNADGTAMWPGMKFSAAPGDTLTAIGARLGVDPAELAVADGTTDAGAVLATGVKVTGTVPRVNEVKPAPLATKLDTDISAVVDGCAVVVTSTTDADLRVYGGAGMVALGDLPRGGELRLTTLPVGPTLLAAYSPSGAQPVLPPSAPVTATVPDECARDAWKGNAYITGGLLLTDAAVAKPYAYISVDKGEWRRLPAKDGTYFTQGSASLADLRALIDLAHYDQIDLEVWSGASGAEAAATGQYCRKDAAHEIAGGSSASGGECQPPGASPAGAPATSPTDSLELTVTAGKNAAVGLNLDPEDPLTVVGVSGPTTLKLTAPADGYTVVFQFSYVPFSSGSTGLNPPGVFWSAEGGQYDTYSVEPWKWHGATITEETLSGVDNLSLNDQLALDLAKQHIAAGANLVDTLYVRAVAASRDAVTGKLVSRGIVSNSYRIDMPTGIDGTWPQIDNAAIAIEPGRDLNITSNHLIEFDPALNPGVDQVSGTCVEVAKYPAKDTYEMYPSAMPRWQTPKGEEYSAGVARSWKDTRVSGSSGLSDYALAKQAWPSSDSIYCVDAWAPEKRQAEANAAEPPSCTLGCVLSFVVYGAIQGFVVGGPYGALGGALVGLGLGLGSAADPSFYASVMAAWDEVAGFYNQTIEAVWEIVAVTNVACLQMSALGTKAHAFCDQAFQTVGTALISYYTGVPPQLATSEQLYAIQQADMEAALVFALDQGLNKLGLSCSTFTISSGEATTLATQVSGYDVDLAVSSVTNEDGDISGCAALAKTLGTAMQSALDQRQTAVMSAITGEAAIPGLLLSPVSETQPVIRFTGVPKSKVTTAASCPVVANIEITEGVTTYRLYPVSSTVVVKHSKAKADGTQAAATWSGEIVVPTVYELGSPYVNAKKVLKVVPASGNAPYLHAEVSGACFDGPLMLDVDDKFDSDTPTSHAYTVDRRPIIAFH